jgi:hypothetical protein
MRTMQRWRPLVPELQLKNLRGGSEDEEESCGLVWRLWIPIILDSDCSKVPRDKSNTVRALYAFIY